MPTIVALLRPYLHSIRHALRIIRYRPTIVAVIVSTLTLGIGLPIAVFASLESLAAPSLRGQYASLSDRLVLLPTIASYTGYTYARERIRTLALSPAISVVAHPGDGPGAEPMHLQCVSHTFLGLFDALPVIGRPFDPGDDVPNASPILLLAHSTWRRVFTGHPNAIGTVMRLNGRSYTVVGVMPPDFVGDGGGMGPTSSHPDAWTLLEASPKQCLGVANPRDDSMYHFRTVGRLRGTFSATDARQELLSQRDALEARQGTFAMDDSVLVPMYGRRDASPSSLIMGWAGASAAAVAGLASATVALLLFLNIIQRRMDILSCLQMGAPRFCLFLQFVVEALVVGALCTVPAVSVSVWVSMFMDSVVPVHSMERLLTPNRLVAVASIVLGAGLVSGLGPAAAGAATPLSGAGARHGGVTTKAQAVALDVVVAGQIAAGVVLVTLAGLFVRSAISVYGAAGYELESLIVVTAVQSRDRDGDPSEPSRRLAALTGAQERVERVPTVRATALSSGVPLSGVTMGGDLVWGSGGPAVNSTNVIVKAVAPAYFEVADTRIVRGRPLQPGDTVAGSVPVVIVSERLASELWPANDAIGSCLYSSADGGQSCARVVGIAETRRFASVMVATDEVFVPLAATIEASARGGPRSLLIRTSVSSREALGAVAGAVRTVPGVPGVERPGLQVRSLWDVADDQTRVLRLATLVCVVFGLLGAVLASLGVYGTTATALRRRIPEMGIRMAVGARPVDIAWLIAGRGAGVLIAGLVVGGLVVVSVTPVVAATLVDVAPVDLLTFVAAAIAVAAAVAVGVGTVAIRAGRVSPALAGRDGGPGARTTAS